MVTTRYYYASDKGQLVALFPERDAIRLTITDMTQGSGENAVTIADIRIPWKEFVDVIGDGNSIVSNLVVHAGDNGWTLTCTEGTS